MMARLWSRWAQFWFAPVSARAVGVMRAALGLVLLGGYIANFPDLVAMVGPNTGLSLEFAHGTYGDWSLHRRVGTDAALLAVQGGVMAVTALFTVGLGGRAAGVATLLGQMSLYWANPAMMHGADRLLRLWTLFLLTVPCTRAFSVDAWIARRRGRARPDTVPIFAHRLVQLQLCWLYFSSALDKAEGRTWQDGTAVYYALLVEEYQRFPGWPTPEMLAGPLPLALIAVSTWVALAWEGLFAFTVWPRRTRGPTLLVGLGVHAGISATLLVGLFSPATVWGYLAFLRPERLAAWGRGAAPSGTADAASGDRPAPPPDADRPAIQSSPQ